jgi:hypothetical protein
MKRSFIFIFIAFAFWFLSCEEPDDPVISYDYIPRLVSKSINSIDIFWDEAPMNNFQYYDIFYRESYVTEPKHYITISNKWEVYTSIVGLLPNTDYKIIIVTTDKSGNKYTSKELSERTYNDVPSNINVFRADSYTIRIDQMTGDTTISSITFVWDKYSNSYAVPFSRYEIYMGTHREFICNDYNKIRIIGVDWNTEVIIYESLRIRQYYYFKLRTYNTLEKYSESAVLEFRRDW